MDRPTASQKRYCAQQGLLSRANLTKQGLLALALLFLPACATSSYKNIQPQINTLVVARHFDQATQLMNPGPSVYGHNNELLYWLDRGFLLHLAGHYKESISAFENAKKLYDALYGHSASEVAGSILVNDSWKKYRGEDFEYVLLNAFQSLNFAAMGNTEEALADMRNIDLQLKLINDRYNASYKNVYRDDAFVRLLAGVYYEAQGDSAGLNDAFIANTRALQVYEGDYLHNYHLPLPLVLKSNLLTTAAAMGDDQLRPYQNKFSGVPLVKESQKQSKAEVYLIEYMGFIPLKVAESVIVPVPAGMLHAVKFSFPKYMDRDSETQSSVFIASANGVEVTVPTDITEDIGAIAKHVLENRKAWMMTKGALRPLGKLAVEVGAEEALRARGNDIAAGVLAVLGSIYNVATEEADVRGWETLPNDIHMARILLEPGTYEFFVQDMDAGGVVLERKSLGTFTLKSGEKKFFINRSVR